MYRGTYERYNYLPPYEVETLDGRFYGPCDYPIETGSKSFEFVIGSYLSVILLIFGMDFFLNIETKEREVDKSVKVSDYKRN